MTESTFIQLDRSNIVSTFFSFEYLFVAKNSHNFWIVMNSTTRASTSSKRSADDESENSHTDKRGRHKAEIRTMTGADETQGVCTCEHPDLSDGTNQADAVSGRHIEINGPNDMNEYAVRVEYINRPIPAGLDIEENAVEMAVNIAGAFLDQCILCNIDHIDEIVRDAQNVIRKTAIAVAMARDEKLLSDNLDGAVLDELPRYLHYVAEAAIFKVDNPILRLVSHNILELPPFLCFEANSLADVLVAVPV